MIIRFHDGEVGDIRSGDVVFSFDQESKRYPLHVGICINPTQTGEELTVRGLPQNPDADTESDTDKLGDAVWIHWGKALSPRKGGAYNVYLGGKRVDVPGVRVKEVKLVADAHSAELSVLGESCVWEARERIHTSRTIRDGIPVFLAGSCSQYVEFLYAACRLRLVDRAVTRDPQSPTRIYPSTQVRAFWGGNYPLRVPWCPELSAYPDCVAGVPRSTDA